MKNINVVSLCLTCLIALFMYYAQQRWEQHRPGIHIHCQKLELFDNRHFDFDADNYDKSIYDASVNALNETMK